MASAPARMNANGAFRADSFPRSANVPEAGGPQAVVVVPPLTVPEKACDPVPIGDAESCTDSVNEYGPETDGVPVIWIEFVVELTLVVLEVEPLLMARPTGNAPEVIDHWYGCVPDGVDVIVIGVTIVPLVSVPSVVGDTVNVDPPVALIVIFCPTVTVFKAESVTVAEKL